MENLSPENYRINDFTKTAVFVHFLIFHVISLCETLISLLFCFITEGR